uniref:Uncharacterized protein n=1 Tax=Callorhinchus milii TaxID=7868 RepID=A0A4W3HRR2_CALMI
HLIMSSRHHTEYAVNLLEAFRFCDLKAAKNNSYVLSFQIWDTAGQERFRSVTHAYYRDAHGKATLLLISVPLIFSPYHVFETSQNTSQNILLRELTEYGVPFMETSAKTGLNVELAFIAIAKELKHRSMKSPSDPKFKLHDYVNSEMKGSGCCKS